LLRCPASLIMELRYKRNPIKHSSCQKVVLAPTNLMISQCRSFKQSSNIWLNRDGESLPAHCSSPTVFSVGLNRFPGLQNHGLYNSATIHLYSEKNYIPKENCLKPRWWMSEDCWHKKKHMNQWLTELRYNISGLSDW
jgi:hypothetical protein